MYQLCCQWWLWCRGLRNKSGKDGVMGLSPNRGGAVGVMGLSPSREDGVEHCMSIRGYVIKTITSLYYIYIADMPVVFRGGGGGRVG